MTRVKDTGSRQVNRKKCHFWSSNHPLAAGKEVKIGKNKGEIEAFGGKKGVFNMRALLSVQRRLNGRWESFGFLRFRHRGKAGWGVSKMEIERDSRCCEALPSRCLSSLCLIGLPPPSPHPTFPPPLLSITPLLPSQLWEEQRAASPGGCWSCPSSSSSSPCSSPPPAAGLAETRMRKSAWRERTRTRGEKRGGATDFNSSDGSHLFSQMIEVECQAWVGLRIQQHTKCGHTNSSMRGPMFASLMSRAPFISAHIDYKQSTVSGVQPQTNLLAGWVSSTSINPCHIYCASSDMPQK